jgi:uncharacterized membrane protein
MADAKQQLVFRWTAMPVRVTASILIGAAVFALSYRLRTEMSLLLAYNLSISTYLALQLLRMVYADEAATRDLMESREASNATVLTMAVLLTACSLTGVAFMLQHSSDWTRLKANIHLGLSLLAVFLSWALLHIVFGIHYARLYYDPTPPAGEPADRPPLAFPDDAQPDYWDFMYFSFTLAVCYQVSDITIRSRHLRRVALAHMILSFLTVTMILGLVVQIISGLD